MIQLTPEIIECAFENLVKKLQKPDIIVAVPRGGLWLAQYLAYKFDIHKSKIRIALDESELPDAGNILICDDIYDTGKQFKAFKSHKFATLFVRDRGLELPKNLVWGDVIKSDEYLWFPWDFEN